MATRELHLQTVQGYWACRWYDGKGKRRLQRFGSIKKLSRAEAEEAFSAFLAKWSNDPQTRTPTGAAAGTVQQLADAYVAHAETYYRKNGRPTGEAARIRDAMRPVLRCCGKLPVAKFSPADLEACRDEMIRKGWARTTINKSCERIRRVFKWGTRKAGLPVEVWYGLLTVEPLKKGRTEARESAPVLPVPEEHLAAVLPFLPSPVLAMVQLQRLAGMRPGEVRHMRPVDIDQSGDVWTYTPAEHKTDHLGNERIVFLGPQAQDILRPFLALKVGASYLFSPRDALRERYDTCQNHRSQANTKPKTSRRVRDHYGRWSYGQVIAKACKKAGRAAWSERHGDLPKRGTPEHAEYQAFVASYHWAPGQLRHNAATRLRSGYGIETARATLGHKKLSTTEVYAEIDHERARAAMKEVG